MAELSGVAKLSNGSPARRIVATHPLRGHVRTTVPALDGSYAIPGVPKGEWLVTAEGPAGYRPLTHVLDVERIPEAEALYPLVWEAWDFDGSTVGAARASVLTSNPEAGVFVPDRNGIPSRAVSFGVSGNNLYSPSTTVTESIGLSFWFKRVSNSNENVLPCLGFPGRPVTRDMDYSVVFFPAGSPRILARARINSGGAWTNRIVPVDVEVNVWHHVAYMVDAAGLTLWLNGVRFFFEASSVATPAAQEVCARLGYVNGAHLDDVLQFRGVLTDEMAQYLYSAGLGRTWSQIREDAGFE